MISHMKQIEEIFKKENIYNKEFFDYIKTRIHHLPADTSEEWFGCFPDVKNNVLVGIQVVLVPVIKNEKTLLINLHEFYHAYELYQELGSIYQENREEREKKAKAFEEKYFVKKTSHID